MFEFIVTLAVMLVGYECLAWVFARWTALVDRVNSRA